MVPLKYANFIEKRLLEGGSTFIKVLQSIITVKNEKKVDFLPNGRHLSKSVHYKYVQSGA